MKLLTYKSGKADALGVLAARGARREDNEAAGVREERADGQEHRPGDVGDLR